MKLHRHREHNYLKKLKRLQATGGRNRRLEHEPV
jgi:hypothetical protein